LIQEVKLTRFLLIGTYRKDEITSTRVSAVQALSKEANVTIMNLKNWNFETVNQLMASLLQMRETLTESLSKVIIAKSAGNPYFTIEVLKAIESHHLLKFSLTKFCMEWDAELIQSDINVGDNLVELFLSKLKLLPFDSQRILILSSCFGAKFDANLVANVVMKLYSGSEGVDNSQFMALLNIAANEGIITSQRTTSAYKFVHDKVYEAIYSQVCVIGGPDTVHFRIGSILLDIINEEVERNLIFLTVRQFSKCLHLVDGSPMAERISELNLDAARLAIGLSAFRPAAAYLNDGLYLNRGENWSCHNLRLELLVLEAKVQLCLGDFHKCHAAVEEVIKNAKNKEEAIPVFQYCIDAYGAEGNVNECIRKGLQFARLLGVKLPREFSKLTVVWSLFKAKSKMKKVTRDILLNYPLSNNPSITTAVRILNTIVIYAFQNRMSDLMATVALINTTLILRYGLTDEAGSIFAMYGFLMACTGDFTYGYDIGKVAIQIAERTKCGIPRTFMNYYGGLDHLKNPLHESLEPFLRGYRIGFEVGDTVSGFYCCMFYVSVVYFIGLNLSNLLSNMDTFCQEMGRYNTSVVHDLFRMYHQSVINLTTNVAEPTLLDGDVMIEAGLLCNQVQLSKEGLWFGKLMLAIYFNEYEVMKENLDNLLYGKPRGDVDGSLYYLNMLLWVEGLGFIIVTRKCGYRKYHQLALKKIRKIEKWVKNGNVNCYHSLLHLQAEMGILRRKPESEVKSLYDSAISASRRSGFLNFVAVINERAALYFLEKEDLEWASSYMSRAFDAYHEWGAIRKCSALIERHGNLLSQSLGKISFDSTMDQTITGTFSKGRKRSELFSSTIHSDRSLGL
jgi:predicted ATPase